MGIFLSLDLIAFFVFWELMLVPMYFLIPGWGSANRKYAAMKFFLYTACRLGVPARVARSCSAFLHQADTGVLTFDYRVLAALERPVGHRRGAAVPRLHGRVRDQGAAVPVPHLAARRAHRGTHRGLGGAGRRDPEDGRVRRRCASAFELFPQASVDFAPLFLLLAVIGIVYGSIVAAMQTDLKRVIAYSSVAHMGFILLGIFSLTVIGLDGAAFTMVSHPLTTGALFLVIGMLYERRHTRRSTQFGGIWKSAPILTALFLDRDVRGDRPARASPGSSASSCRCSAPSASTAGTRWSRPSG